MLKNNMLYKQIKVISTIAVLVGCVDINTETASEPVTLPVETLALGQPLELFTDYANFESCLSVEDQPTGSQPMWVDPFIVWQVIRLGYGLDDNYDNPRITAEFNWYARNPTYLKRVSKRSERYIYHVSQEVQKRGMPLELALLPIVESAYDPFAYSHGRASGMWQFIPSTGKHFKLQQNWWYDGRRDVVASTDAALDYLQRLNKLYDGDWLLALAAYNSGQGTVSKAIRKNKAKGKPTDFWSLGLPRETRSYVPKLLALAKIIDDPLRYNTELFPVPNEPYFSIVDTESQIDLAQAAEMAAIDIDELYRLNPGFNRWATAPNGPHRLLVPTSNHQQFETALKETPPSQRLHWQRYTIKSGDSLLLLAKRYNTGVDTIRSINGIKGNMIRAGQSLMIPVAAKGDKHYTLSAEQRLNNIQKNRTGGSNTRQLFHTVKSGESLWTIARHYNVHSKDIARWNGMAPKDYLQPGQKLSIWVDKKLSTTAQAGNRDPIIRKVGYKVRRGDSLARIADRFNLTVKDIVEWNSVKPSKYLQPGQRLTLFVDITNSVN